MSYYRNSEGLKVKVLKALLETFPDQDENGVFTEVWLGDSKYRSNLCTEICTLNGSDVILLPDKDTSEPETHWYALWSENDYIGRTSVESVARDHLLCIFGASVLCLSDRDSVWVHNLAAFDNVHLTK